MENEWYGEIGGNCNRNLVSKSKKNVLNPNVYFK